MPISGSILRQLSTKETWKSTSKRWNNGEYQTNKRNQVVEGFNMYGYGERIKGGGNVMRKRVMVVIDETSRAKHAMMWALSHLANKGDAMTLLHVVALPNNEEDCGWSERSEAGHALAGDLGNLCKACKPEVEIEALVIQGPKLATVLSQVRKLEASVLVLGHKKPSSPFFNCLCGVSSSEEEEFVEQCINGADCLTIGVRKQSKSMGGYLISTRWQKDFWLLA